MPNLRPSSWPARAAIALFVVLLAAAVLAWWLLRGSLPQLEGEVAVPGMSAPVSVQRDALGVVTIDAANEADAARALGYVHAQERYFEMDLLRRTAAGELAELFGPVAIDADRAKRVHRMRSRVRLDLAAISGPQREMLQAYTEGVNAGLADLAVRPWPYLLLRTLPQPWRVEDSPLVAMAMYFDLQDSANSRELALARIRPHLPPALYALLTHPGSSWDAPLSGGAVGDAKLPSADEVDLRRLENDVERPTPRLPAVSEVGSNNFAVSGALTEDGRSIVADDMHLGLRAPNIWFRAQLRYPDPAAPGGRVDVGGFTLPGQPVVVVGSNGHVAWGFTNSYGDWLDWQRLSGCGARPQPPQCRTTTHVERIRVAGAEDVLLPVEETPWGPVLHREANGDAFALRWVAHLPGALTMGLADFARVASVDEAMRAADNVAIPAQNLLVGDRTGRIGWRLLGPMPARTLVCDASAGSDPRSFVAVQSAGCPPWSLSNSTNPRIVDPAHGRLWTANSRVADGPALARIGDGGYVLGARGQQIRDALFAKSKLDEEDLLAIQLDDRTLFLERWWQLLRQAAASTGTPALDALASADANWPTHAVADSTSYRIVRAWRLEVLERIADGLTAPAQAALGDSFEMPSLPQLEGAVWPMLQQRPAHLLPPRFKSWDALLEDAARDVRNELAEAGPLSARTWGERNTARICHPMARALPVFTHGILCMPAEPLRGDTHMPRVQGPDSGASQRMVVSPGNEREGIIQMPGGQSGHLLSPFWGAGHDDWVHGRPSPFLPGPTRYSMQLSPASAAR
ncbi:penicillin acylase family protein [Lysobacter korlensis]|uniref:Penicillin acylase family protein n=1 Tax=Lysobacter korlensis TaxID=553636 RepID=A0ABV6RR17_9GAMM